MGKKHAKIFSDLSSILLEGAKQRYMFLPDLEYLNAQFGISGDDLIELKELGLIERKQPLERPSILNIDKDTIMFTYYNKLVFVYARPDDMETSLSNINFINITRTGVELLKLIDSSEIAPGYIEIIKSHFCEKTIKLREGKCSLKFGNITSEQSISGDKSGRNISFDKLKLIF